MPAPKIMVFDIETSNLKANFGGIFCIGWKWVGRRAVYVPSILDYHDKCDHCGRILNPEDDKQLVADFAQQAAEADILVSWYGKGFDVPFIQSRLIYHGLPPFPPTPHIDGCRNIAQRTFALSSNRLNVWQDFLRLDDRKTPLTSKEWNAARAGKLSGLRYVINHCKQDVKVLEAAYLKLRPFMASHPNVALLDELPGGCPTCNGYRLHSRGEYVSATRRYQRLQCQDCGSWMKVPKSTLTGGLQSLATRK